MRGMRSPRVRMVGRWVATFGALAVIVLVYREWVHVNPTTVALTLVLFVLLVAARLSLRYAVAVSVAATTCFNFYFLEPVGTFRISDPQNLVALFAFLATSVVGSRLSEKAREEAEEARRRQRELENLFALGRELLGTDDVAAMASSLPGLINRTAGAERTELYLLEGERVYEAGRQPGEGMELPPLREAAKGTVAAETLPGDVVLIPLRAGGRARGLLRITGLQFSDGALNAMGGLAAIALDRARALEAVARSEANKESERLRTLILDSITHELRTPLTSIKGAIGSLLAVENLTEDDRHELLTIIEEEADRLNRLTGQAVEMAQIETQEIRMDFAPMDLRALVTEALENCAWIATTHTVSVNIPELPRVNADRVMVGKVLCNLLENAAKYSEAGTPIMVSAEQNGPYVTTHVADRGVGVEPAEQALIFERLYRSSRHSQQKPGTGMGLAISRAIIEAHGGTLRVESRAGEGAVFSFTLRGAVQGASYPG